MILSPSKEVRKKEVYDKKRRKENIKKFELVLSLGMMAPYILCITDSPLLALFALALFAVHHTSWTQMVSCVVLSAEWDLSFNIIET